MVDLLTSSPRGLSSKKMSNKYGFNPRICTCCGQAETYPLPIDWGTAVIVKAVARAIRIKGINVIHPTKEMEVPANEWTYDRAINEGKLTSIQIGNFTRAKAHGLIAMYKKESGNWVLTSKGAQFLRGESIPKIRVRKKQGVSRELTQEEKYWKPEDYRITIHEILRRGSKTPIWEGIDFDIREGRIVLDFEDGTTKPMFHH